ncbi:MAG: C4-type zinc ribbon domain-containing protein [Dehalococcoidales bacterium]
MGVTRALTSARSDLAAQGQRLEELSREQKTLEWEIDDQSGKIAVLEEKLYSGKVSNPKELASLQQDVLALKKRRQQVEDRALEVMEQREITEAGVESRRDELAGMEKTWRAEQLVLEGDARELSSRIESLERRRQELKGGLDGGLGEYYEKLRVQKGSAVASVEQGICQGCRISLSQAQLQQVRTGGFVHCGNCGRVLYLA